MYELLQLWRKKLRKFVGLAVAAAAVRRTFPVALQAPKSIDVPRGRQPRREPLPQMAPPRLELSRNHPIEHLRGRRSFRGVRKRLVPVTPTLHVPILRRETAPCRAGPEARGSQDRSDTVLVEAVVRCEQQQEAGTSGEQRYGNVGEPHEEKCAQRFRVRGRKNGGVERQPADAAGAAKSGHVEAQRARFGAPGQEPVVAVLAAAVRVQQPELAERDGAVASQPELERDLAELVATRAHHPAGAESDQGARRGLLHVRDPLGAVLRAQPAAHRVRGVRAQHRQLGVPVRHVARLRQLARQPDLLHHLQQGVPAGLQEGAALSLPQPDVAPPQMTGPRQAERASRAPSAHREAVLKTRSTLRGLNYS